MPSPKKTTYKEAKYLQARRLSLPLPVRNSKGDLEGYKWTNVDLCKLLRMTPEGYDVFREAEGFIFSTDIAKKIVAFIINECCFPEGKLTGKPFVPEKWQWCIFLNIYCWVEKKDLTIRRFNEVFIYVPRKNGKTVAFGAIPALISIFVDVEKRSQNFCCAADVDQANLNFRHAAYMVEQNPRLLNRLQSGRVQRSVKTMEHKNGKYLKVLSSVAETKHGLSPNYVGVDELHAHKSSELVDVMATGTAARDNPLTITTTTSDYSRPSLCNETHARALKVCKGLVSDPHFLPVIYEAKVTDDWENPETWKKANPNFGISVTEKYFRKEIARVRNNPTLLNRFLRLHLNIKTSVETEWISPVVWCSTNPKYSKADILTVEHIRSLMEERPFWFPVVSTELWKESSIDLLLEEHRSYYTWFFKVVEERSEASCFASYDNTSTRDIASFCLFFPDYGDVLSWNFVPADTIDYRSVEENVPYDLWKRSGLIINTPQATIDERQVIKTIIGDEGVLCHFTNCQQVLFDRWNSNFIHTELENYGFDCIAYPQSFTGMNGPAKKVEELLDQKRLFHGGNKVLEWMIGNVMMNQNSDEKKRPDKSKSTDKIDGIVSLLMAVGGWLNHTDTVIEVPIQDA